MHSALIHLARRSMYRSRRRSLRSWAEGAGAVLYWLVVPFAGTQQRQHVPPTYPGKRLTPCLAFRDEGPYKARSGSQNKPQQRQDLESEM